MTKQGIPAFCCDMMRHNATLTCVQHDSPFDCPDTLIHRCEDGRHGIIIHDGGSSFIIIAHCPWCGTKLPTLDFDPGERAIDVGSIEFIEDPEAKP
jgi:hypothetical protein